MTKANPRQVNCLSSNRPAVLQYNGQLSGATLWRISAEMLLALALAIQLPGHSSAGEASPTTGENQQLKAAPVAELLLADIRSHGHTAVYDIHFDGGDATLQTQASHPALEEIAKLLKSNPPLNLLVVVHTDHTGTIGHNLDLSRRRAIAVVNALVTDYGIDKGRLTPAGVGYLSPVASNHTAEGRAHNRRVELVERLE